jgi:hypothetical protein
MYDYAQTFYMDKAKVKGSPQVNVSRVDLYFKKKPKVGEGSETNKSGIVNPGVEVSIVETRGDGTPNLTKVLETTRVEYGKITTSGDATAETSFIFDENVFIKTDKLYAIYIRFDGMEDYELWTDKKGYYYVGTDKVSPGVSDKLVGNLYKTEDRLTADFDPNAAGGGGANQGVNDKATWVAMKDEDLTFEVYVCRYRDTGSSNSSNSVATVNYTLPTTKSEFILYDAKWSKKEAKAHVGEKIFQVGPIASNNGSIHTVNIQKGNSTITSPTANFEMIFTNAKDQYIVLLSKNHDDSHITGDRDRYCVGKVLEVDGDTITINKAPPFSNSVANFFVSPIAEVDFLDRTKSFNGKGNSPSWDYGDRNKQDLLVLQNSNANVTHRFVNNSIYSISVSAPGSNYSNTDYLVITSASSNSINAYANVRTNASGNITSVILTNAGAGIIATPSVAVKNSSNLPSTGTGATFTMKEGPWLKSEVKKYVFKDVEVIDFEIDAATPDIKINNPAGTAFVIRHQVAYVKAANGDYIVNPNATANRKLLKNLKKNKLDYTDGAALMSRSNEVIQLEVVTGDDTHIVVDSESDNDFICTASDNDTVIYYHKYLINNDYTNEHTSYGNALAKHITTRVNFSEGRLAEDAIVIMRAFRPPGTDFKVYSKLYNSQDPEAFDDKNWTLMECTSGANEVSSAKDEKDVREFTYGIPQSPNTTIKIAGRVTLENGNSTVIGSGTSFLNELEGINAGDLVKIYDPLFVDDKHFIVSVNSVTNDTTLVLDDFTTNTSLVGTSLRMDKLGYKNQAFRNINNDNVVRYYNSSMHVYDGYDTMAIKVVMLSSNTKIIPEIEDIRSIGVSA